MRLKEISEGLRDPKDNPCWKGYKPVGTKKKNGKTVPNCVPKESVEEASEDKDLETKFMQRQIRARYPQAKDLESAMALDYFKSQRQDRVDIGRLDQENDQEDEDIDRLERENDQEQEEIARLKQMLSRMK